MIPKGIHNLGNTCFINACMQILLQTNELDILGEDQDQDQKEDLQKHLECKIFQEWKLWKQNINNPEIPIISPNSFIITIHQVAQSKNFVLFTGFTQNDMPEFLLFLIESLHIYSKTNINYSIHGKIENDIDKLALQTYKMIKSRYENDYSPLIDIFYGISISSIYDIPNKNLISSVSEPFFLLDLPIYGKTIYDCLDNYITYELIDNENAWFNEKTQQKEDVFKRITFWNFPKILIITFKRFHTITSPIHGMQLCKKTDFIDFPIDNLDLSKYIQGYNASKFKYELYGVCNHIGNVMGGHYTSFVKNNENQWFHCNDTIIEKIENPQQIITAMAYSVFYRRYF